MRGKAMDKNGENSKNSKIRVAGIVKESIVDGPGIRYVIFTQGCKLNCEGCHNPQTHPFDGGTLTDIQDLAEDIKKNPFLDGVTFSGGEPFEQAAPLAKLAEMVKKTGLDVITYTGYTYEYIIENCDKHDGWKELLEITDILIDGRFEKVKKSLALKFRGSSNQRIIDVKESLRSGEVKEIEL